MKGGGDRLDSYFRETLPLIHSVGRPYGHIVSARLTADKDLFLVGQNERVLHCSPLPV